VSQLFLAKDSSIPNRNVVHLGQKFNTMQFKLPLFPGDTKMINDYIGFRRQDDFVYYLHSGSPVYCHKIEDKNSYRQTLASLIVNNLCTITELSNALGINRKKVECYAKALREHGSEWFFNREDGRGQCHKMTAELLAVIQQKLNSGLSKYRISKEHNISDSAIDYHLDKGTLKKSRV
jgi:biotin operon repressor